MNDYPDIKIDKMKNIEVKRGKKKSEVKEGTEKGGAVVQEDFCHVYLLFYIFKIPSIN